MAMLMVMRMAVLMAMLMTMLMAMLMTILTTKSRNHYCKLFLTSEALVFGLEMTRNERL